jgi:hypothetical protein
MRRVVDGSDPNMWSKNSIVLAILNCEDLKLCTASWSDLGYGISVSTRYGPEAKRLHARERDLICEPRACSSFAPGFVGSIRMPVQSRMTVVPTITAID